MYGKDVQAEAHKAAEDLRTGMENGDISQAIRDIADLDQFLTADERKAYLEQVNKEAKAFLPDVEIIGAGAQNLIVADRTSRWNRYYVAGSRADHLSELKLPSVSLDKHEKRGNLDVTVNESNELTSVMLPDGTVYLRNPDGEWNTRSKTGYGGFVEHLAVDQDGNMSFDTEENHVVSRADGSQTITGKSDGLKYEVGSNGQVVEMPAGKGHSRRFHYDEKGELDQIDGRLGHWERRADKQGQPEWVNTDTKAVWKGKLWVDSEGNLRFTARNGHHWAFTPQGKSERRLFSM